jgi:AcrR family transcriptional regulator
MTTQHAPVTGRTVLANPSVELDITDSAWRAARSSSKVADALGLNARRDANGGGGAFLSREHVLEAAQNCLDELGYDGTTIRAIAGRLGCAVGSLYRYFPDKRSMMLALGERVIEPIAAGVEAGELDMAGSITLYLQHVSRREEAYRMLFWLWRSDEVQENLPLPIRRIVDCWAKMLGSEEQAMRQWALLHGLLMAGVDHRWIQEALEWRDSSGAGRKGPEKFSTHQGSTDVRDTSDAHSMSPSPLEGNGAEEEEEGREGLPTRDAAAPSRLEEDDVTLL